MNDATELESSLAGAIGFFQNLRQKLGALETDASARHDQLHSLSSTLAAVEQDRKTDRQALASLSGGLVKLQVEEHRLEQQINAVETRVAGFQQDQQHLQQALAAIRQDLHTPDNDWRRNLEASLTQKLAPIDQLAALEQHVSRHQEQIGQLATTVATQGQRLLQLDQGLDRLHQQSHSVHETLEALKTDLEQQVQGISTLEKTTGQDAAVAKQQLQAQQDRLDALMGLATLAEQDLQTLRHDITQIKSESEVHHGMQVDIAQIRQELQKNPDRVKHLETLMSKVSADTNSTRQILNVVQADLVTQNDTLRELDQNWRESLSGYQDRLSSVEIVVASSTARPAALPDSAQIAPVELLAIPPIDENRVAALETALDTARRQHEALEHQLGTVQNALERLDADTALESLRQAISEQAEALAETQQLAWSQIQDLQQRLSEAEATLDSPAPAPEPAKTTNPDQDAALESLRQAMNEQAEALAETQQLAWSQIQDLQQRLSEAEATLDSPAPEPAKTTNPDQDAALESLRQIISEQSEALAETQQLAWSQIQDLQQRLSEAEATLDSPAPEPVATTNPDQDATLESLHQAISEQAEALAETQQLAWSQIQDLQQRLSEAEATLDSPAPEPVATTNPDQGAALDHLRADLSAQIEALERLRENGLAQAASLEKTTQEQLTALNATLNVQQQDFHDAVNQLAKLQQELHQLQQATPTASDHAQRLDIAEQSTQELRHELETLQESVTTLETRLSSQSQAFSGNFEQLRNLHADLHTLQQQMAVLDSSPRQLAPLEQALATHQQEINQLQEVIEQVQADAQQTGDSPITEVMARLDEQQEQWSRMATTVESIRADSKAAQETVVTMATNVAKRIHEIQNLLVVTENTQSERLQEVEQKLIQLQAAFETLETRHKPRKWFAMPASLTSILLAASLGGLATIAQALWAMT